jgi:hypothetical protein
MPGLKKIKQRMWAWMLFRILLMLELKGAGDDIVVQHQEITFDQSGMCLLEGTGLLPHPPLMKYLYHWCMSSVSHLFPSRELR